MTPDRANSLMLRPEQYRWIVAPSPRGTKHVDALLCAHDGINAIVIGDYNGPRRSPLKNKWVVPLTGIIRR